MLALLCLTLGCHGSLLHSQPDFTGAGRMVENPLFIATGDREYLWFQVVDTLDDYFRIEREERVRLIGEVLTEGRIDTYPQIGGTLLEPWRADSTPGYEKLHATLQTIRRRASVRVIPTQGGYLVEVAVYKELEDLDRPQLATVGTTAVRHDGSLTRGDQIMDDQNNTLGWIPLGRDPTLEQRILKNIVARVGDQATTALPPPGY